MKKQLLTIGKFIKFMFTEGRFMEYGFINLTFGFTGLLFLILWITGREDFSILSLCFVGLCIFIDLEAWKKFRKKLKLKNSSEDL